MDTAAQHFGLAIGVMSGTSCDGVDAIMLDLESVTTPHAPKVVGRSSLAFTASLGHELRAPEKLSTQRICELQYELPEYYVAAIKELPNYAQARVCGVHGQTIWHQTGPTAARRGTLQIGSSAVVAARTGVPTVGDMRAMDVSLGGLGAPIAPFAHWFFSAQAGAPTVVINFGGMCNLTYVAPQLQDVVAYDVGPGMVLSDAFAQACGDGQHTFDTDGVLSAGGRIIDALLAAIVAHPFVARLPPKSTGREEFGAAYACQLFERHARGQRPQDVAYTLLAATAHILHLHVARDARIPKDGLEVVLSGGGALNPTLVELVRQAFDPAPVQVKTEGVFAPQNHEPAAMAIIAARTLAQLPSGLPQVTGASAAAILGHVSRAVSPS